MALVTIVGFPCSGKSTRAAEIARDFQRRLDDPAYSGPKLKIVVVDDDNSHVPRKVYDDSISEKPARANIFTAVTRALGPESIVICDSLNYIKGFRYQMYCAAREAHVRVCTIHIATPPAKCEEWHSTRGECSYAPATLENLFLRFEEPSSMVRWDSPLFTLPWDEDPPFQGIWDVVIKGERKPPLAAVLAKPKPPPNTLQILSTTTTLIISSLLTHLALSPTATTFPIPSPPAPAPAPAPHSTNPPLTLHLPFRRVTLPELQRLKRQYEGVQTKAHASGGRAAGNWTEASVASGFVRFLETTWDTAE